MIHAHRLRQTNFNTLSVMSVCIIIALSGCIFTKPSPERKHGFTAMEKYGIAFNISKAWKNDSAFINANGASGFNDGRADIWSYVFVSNSTYSQINTNTSGYQSLIVFLYSNGSHILEYSNVSTYNIVKNWTIDSDQAFQIMIKTSNIKEYINKPGVYLSEFSIASPTLYSKFKDRTDLDDAVWHAQWIRSPEYESPNENEIWISANNSTVLPG